MRFLSYHRVIAPGGLCEIVCSSGFVSDAALFVIRLGHVEVKAAHHSVCRPRQPDHGREPRQRSGEALVDAPRGQQ